MRTKLRTTLAVAFALGAVLAGPGAANGQGQGPLADHGPGIHAFQPARLQTIVPIYMHEMYFGNPEGEKNPTYRIPAETTVGIHIHNEGAILHEMMIGRGGSNGNYDEVLTELVPSDLFFYYGSARIEVESAWFEEIEVDPAMRGMWIRINVPAEFKGTWELGCFVAGHYEAGMYATLIVE